MRLESFGTSDVGHVRKNNEDFWALNPDEQFYVLADGMGGHRAGEIASQKTVEQMCEAIRAWNNIHESHLSDETLKYQIFSTIQSVNRSIYSLSRQNPSWRGMGTTLCSTLFHSNKVIYSHVGDSRIYRYRRDELEQLTDDHTLFESGDQSQNRVSSLRKRLTRAVGTSSDILPDIGISPIEPGDVYLLCSDGLTDDVRDEEIQVHLQQNLPLERVSLDLIERAKKRGGRDNITLLLIRVSNDLPGQQCNHTNRS